MAKGIQLLSHIYLMFAVVGLASCSIEKDAPSELRSIPSTDDFRDSCERVMESSDAEHSLKCICLLTFNLEGFRALECSLSPIERSVYNSKRYPEMMQRWPNVTEQEFLGQAYAMPWEDIYSLDIEELRRRQVNFLAATMSDQPAD
ncbi:MAG: hypothetical protein ACI9MC_002179 [Kiritimatiellia bacterium]|jgi:hypothetical protein